MGSWGHTTTEVNGGLTPIAFEERDFNICPLPAINENEMSILLVSGRSNGRSTTLDFNGEQIIVWLVKDILKGLGMGSHFNVHTQMVPDLNERGDIYIVTVFGIILLLIEVKRPSVFKPQVHAECLGQVYDYLADNRSYYSHGYSFGVWSTYEEMRLVWPDDDMHNELALSTVVNTEVKYPLPEYDYNW